MAAVEVGAGVVAATGKTLVAGPVLDARTQRLGGMRQLRRML